MDHPLDQKEFAGPRFDYARSAGYNFTVISNKLSRGLTKLLQSKAEIGVIEWRVLVHLAIDSPMIARDIGRIATIDKALISKAFKALAGKELISLTCLPNESRPRLASLTAKGVALHDEILPLVQAREAAVFTDLSKGEIDQLFLTLGKIRENLTLL